MRPQQSGPARGYDRLRAPAMPEPAPPLEAAAPVEPPGPAAAPPAPQPEPPPQAPLNIAVIAIHGMGNQLEFQTLDEVASRIADITEAHENREVGLVARAVKAGTDPDLLRRLELTVDGGQRAVHVYEAYWAPLTEGRIGVKDVLAFLLRAGWNSLWSVGRQFRRWMFGGPQDLNVEPGTRGYLTLALAVVLGLTGLNLAAVTVHAMRAAGKLTGDALLFSQDLTAGLFAVAATALVFVALLGICQGRWSARRGAPGASLALPSLLTGATWSAFFLATLATSGVALWLAYAAVHHRLSPASHWAHPGGVFTSPWALTAAYAVVLVVSWFAKSFLVQYAGDVAAYVFAHRLDRFAEIRAGIKARACTTAKAVFELAQDGAWVYDRVLFVGHSLGSVVAYDTLNKLLAEDDATGDGLKVLDRTKMLLTFGSPLDKTAFLFRMQGGNERYGREALAATAQPLIQHPRFRPAHLQWVNVHAAKGADIIGSALGYYDGTGAAAVRNVPDRDASVPIAAHTQHWKTDAVWGELYRRLLSC